MIEIMRFIKLKEFRGLKYIKGFREVKVMMRFKDLRLMGFKLLRFMIVLHLLKIFLSV